MLCLLWMEILILCNLRITKIKVWMMPNFLYWTLCKSNKKKPKSHARLLFAYFSSTFNKMQPHILLERIASYFNLPDQLLMVILHFLTERVQQVFVNGKMSNTTMSNTGFPQGCLLSSLLLIMFTDSCRTSQENRTDLSLLQGSEPGHGPASPECVHWCDDGYLDLNVSKTKEMIIDLRHKSCTEQKTSFTHGEDVQIEIL